MGGDIADTERDAMYTDQFLSLVKRVLYRPYVDLISYPQITITNGPIHRRDPMNQNRNSGEIETTY